MNSKFPHPFLEQLEEAPLSPRSPRNKIQRKPDNLRTKFLQERQKRQASKGHQYNVFHSPKREKQSPQMFNLKEPNIPSSSNSKVLINHRSLSHFSKAGFSKNPYQRHQYRNKQNSVSASSERSSRERQRSRVQLELKALSCQNARLKNENKSLQDENKFLRSQIIKISEQMSRRVLQNSAKPALEQRLQIEMLNQTVQNLQIQLKSAKMKIIQIQLLKQSKLYLESLIKTFQTINQQQKEELFKQLKQNKYLQIQLRTLKKQKADQANNKVNQSQFLSLESDNRKLRKMVSDLQSRLKSTLLFDLTPEPSEKNESFLLD